MESKENLYPISDNIEDFINEGGYLFIYRQLTEKIPGSADWIGTFEPLYYFNLLETSINYCIDNANNYIKIKSYFDQILAPMTSKQKVYFLIYATTIIGDYWFPEKFPDSIGELCDYLFPITLKEIQILVSETDEDEDEDNTYVAGNYIAEFLQHTLNKIPENNKKLKYLYDLIARYKQGELTKTGFSDPNFIPCCELEIERINKHIEIENLIPKAKAKGEPTHREIALAYEFRVRAGEVKRLTRAEQREQGGKPREKAFDSINEGSTKHKAPTEAELETVIRLLEEHPNAQKLAINDLYKIQNNL